MIDLSELFCEKGLLQYVKEVCLVKNTSIDIPDLRLNKEAWFIFWDEDNSKSLEKEELFRALKYTFKLEQNMEILFAMKETLYSIFPIFDTDNSGSIEMDEFICPNGVADTIIATLNYI